MKYILNEYVLLKLAAIHTRLTKILNFVYLNFRSLNLARQQKKWLFLFSLNLWSFTAYYLPYYLQHFFFFAKKSLYIKNQLCKIPLKISASTCISFHILADSPEHSNCHLLPYPLNIDVDGNVTSLESPYDCFLDTSAPVCGCKSTYLPGKLTT